MTYEELSLDDLIREVERRAGNDDPANRLAAAAEVSVELGDLADALLDNYVQVARAAGTSWAVIGDALGVTKQGAQKRFVDRPPRPWRRIPERLSPRARDAIERAEAEARELAHTYVGTEHLLVALLADEDATSTKVIRSLGLSPKKVRKATMAELDRHNLAPRGGRRQGASRSGHRGGRRRYPLTPRARRSLMLAAREADGLGSDSIGTGHLLVGLTEVRGGLAARVLAELGVDADAVHAAVADVAGPAGAPTPGQGDTPQHDAGPQGAEPAPGDRDSGEAVA